MMGHMTLSRVLGGVGRTLIGLGVVTLLFAGYQLWGTGIHEARAQNHLENEFERLLADAEAAGLTAPPPDEPDIAVPTETTTTTTDADPSTQAESIADLDLTPEQLAYFFPEGGESVAALEMPSIGVSKIIVEGVTVSDLREGPGHYGATPFPGQPGNSAIAGHRTTYGAPFNRIDELAPGDSILVTTIQGSFEYEVLPAAEAFPDAGLLFGDATRGHLIVSPRDTWVLDDFGDNRLTLTACNPKFSARQRIIVAARLVVPPATAVPRPGQLDVGESITYVDRDSGESVELTGSEELASEAANEAALDEGLGWDTGALPDSVTLALVCIAIVGGAVVVANRWRRRTTYLISIAPFALALWFLFGQVDRLLPAY